jgi:ABC-type transport system involved in multi-copper enzyme maturation permease subunit
MMNSPNVLYVMRLLIRDTFRQAVASSIFWLMLGASSLCILICLSIGVKGATPLHHPEDLPEFLPRSTPVDPVKAASSGVDVVSGELTLGFGAVRLSLGRDAEDAIRFLQLLLTGVVADTAGVLLALLWTAGFIPGFVEPAAASVLLVKPVPRWLLLAGKYLGVLVFVALQAAVFVVGTWLALGVRTGVWHPAYLLCIPILLLHFAIFFSFSTLLGVCTRSTIVCLVGSLFFWFLCWGANFGHLSFLAAPDVALTPSRMLAEASYWMLPKPADVNFLLQQAVESRGFFTQGSTFDAAPVRQAFSPLILLCTSLLFIVVTLMLAGWRLIRTDY